MIYDRWPNIFVNHIFNENGWRLHQNRFPSSSCCVSSDVEEMNQHPRKENMKTCHSWSFWIPQTVPYSQVEFSEALCVAHWNREPGRFNWGSCPVVHSEHDWKSFRHRRGSPLYHHRASLCRPEFSWYRLESCRYLNCIQPVSELVARKIRILKSES